MYQYPHFLYILRLMFKNMELNKEKYSRYLFTFELYLPIKLHSSVRALCCVKPTLSLYVQTVGAKYLMTY